MRIIVDELQGWPQKAKSGGRYFGSGKQSCHLMVEPDERGQVDLEALHAFARRIGLRREWFQPLSWPHYDLTPQKRAEAVRLGAVFVPAREQALMRIAARERLAEGT